MSDLIVTNAFSKGKAKLSLTVKGNVEISNYKQGEAKPSAFVLAKIKDKNVNIETPKGSSETLDLSEEKYNVLVKIAGASKEDGKTELSWYDLRDMDKAKLGLDDSFVIKKDLKAGIANIYKKVGDKLTTWLHIDFETKSDNKTKVNNTTQDNQPKYAELTYWSLGPMDNKANGGVKSKINVPVNTLIETNTDMVVVDEKGQAWRMTKSDYKKYNTWTRTNSLEFMGVLSSKVLKSIADNSNEGQGNLTLSKSDQKFSRDVDTDLTSNMYEGYYKVDRCENYENTLYVKMGSKMFSRVEDNTLNIQFDIYKNNAKAFMQDNSYGSIYESEAARKVYEQISGPSFNKKTFKLINDFSNNELLSTLKYYNNHRVVTDKDEVVTYADSYGTVADVETFYEYNEHGLFEDLNDEWGIGIKEIMPIIDRAVGIIPEYLRDKDEYKELIQTIEKIDRTEDKNFDRETIQKIDNLFAKLL